jgi:hypothetical protein
MLKKIILGIIAVIPCIVGLVQISQWLFPKEPQILVTYKVNEINVPYLYQETYSYFKPKLKDIPIDKKTIFWRNMTVDDIKYVINNGFYDRLWQASSISIKLKNNGDKVAKNVVVLLPFKAYYELYLNSEKPIRNITEKRIDLQQLSPDEVVTINLWTEKAGAVSSMFKADEIKVSYEGGRGKVKLIPNTTDDTLLVINKSDIPGFIFFSVMSALLVLVIFCLIMGIKSSKRQKKMIGESSDLELEKVQ